jgi:hypothetical protein
LVGELTSSNTLAKNQTLLAGLVRLMVIVLLTLAPVSASLARRRPAQLREQRPEHPIEPSGETETKVKRLRRAPVVVFSVLVASTLFLAGQAGAQTKTMLPSVPATMATDVPQRMADGSLFVPKATQHLLAVRTVMTAESRAPRTDQLVGAVIADPNSFGRVQTGHAGRVEPPDAGLPLWAKS